MYLLGLAATLATQSPDPSGVVLNLMLKSGWAIPALMVVLFSTFTTTFLDIYSTGISALNIVPKLGERRGVLIGGVLGTTDSGSLPRTGELRAFSSLHWGHVLSPVWNRSVGLFLSERRRSPGRGSL